MPFALSTPWIPFRREGERNEVSKNARDDEPDPEDTSSEDDALNHEAEPADEVPAAVAVEGGGPTDEEREEIRHLPEGLWQRLTSEPARAPQHLVGAPNRDRIRDSASGRTGGQRIHSPQLREAQIANKPGRGGVGQFGSQKVAGRRSGRSTGEWD